MKERKILRMGTFILALIVILAALVLLAWSLISSGRIREYKDETGNVLEGSISEKIKVDINGASNGLFINGKDLNNPVLLFISSGPGTDDYFLNEKYPDMHLEDEFTVCYWDYKGMGIVYDKELDPETIDMDTLVQDTGAVTEYLKKRFGQEKIFLMAFSGGTNIALQTISKYPDNYRAYIGMAQKVCEGEDNDTLMYNFMKDTFSERQDERRLKRLEQLVDKKENGQVVCHDWYDFVMLLHEAGGGTTMNETEFKGIDIPIMLAHCYTIKEKIDFIKGMKMYRKTALSRELQNIDYRKGNTKYEIPMYFLSGDHDFNCPWPLVRDFCDMIEAPDKGFYLIEDAAHSPLWEQQEESFRVLVEIKDKTMRESD